MVELTYNPVQTIPAGSSAILNTTIGCPYGCIINRNESGVCIVRENPRNRCSSSARYQVTFVGNIALPEGATVGEISMAIAIDGIPIQTSMARITPAAVDQYNNITCTAVIDVPRGCCFNVSAINTSGTTDINLQNANMVYKRQNK